MVHICTDPARLDVDLIHAFLSERAYWAIGRPRALTERAIASSLCFGAYRPDDGAQVGFARVVTDFAVFAYLADVFVVEDARGEGVGKALVAAVVGHEDLRGLRRMVLATDDAHGLYAGFGFAPLEDAGKWMNRRPTA
jgi:GNAT superfamily N-acetyltransferase